MTNSTNNELSSPFRKDPKAILNKLLSNMLNSRLETLETKSRKEILSLEYTKKNINETLNIVNNISISISRHRKSKTPSTLVKRCLYSKNIQRPMTPIQGIKKVMMTTTSSSSKKSKTPSHLSKTPVIVRKRKNHMRNISGMLGNVSNIDDELLTTISTDIYTRNSILPSYVMFSLEKLFDKDCIFVKFLPIKDVLNFILINKFYGVYFIDEIINRIEKMKLILNKEIDSEIKEVDKSENYNKIELKEFVLSNKAKKALYLLDERSYMDIFNVRRNNINNNTYQPIRNRTYTNSIPNDNVIKIYQILMQLTNKQELLTYINNKEVFWQKLCNYFNINAKGQFGTFIINLIEHFDYSKENREKVVKMSSQNLQLFTPSFFTKLCSTTALLVFALKDVMEYIGINITLFTKILNKKGKVVKYTQILKRMNTIKETVFNKYKL